MPLQLSDLSDAESPEKEYLWTLNFGPQHPATHTTLRLVLTLDGETIVNSVPDIGYLHSGFEKLGEDLDFNQYVTIVDRMNYISPIANEIAWHHAVEKLLGVTLTPRCTYLRTILAELMRIHDHLLCIAAAALDLGAFTPFLYAFKQREKISDICPSTLSGQRFHASYMRVGGVMYDVDDAWINRVREFVAGFPAAHAEIAGLLTKNRIFVSRLKGDRRADREDAINYSCTGPSPAPAASSATCGRTSPIWRIRTSISRSSAPTAATASPATGPDAGDAREHQADRAGRREPPSGPVNVDAEGRAIMPGKEEVYQSIEGLIRHFEVIIPNRGFIAAPRGDLRGQRDGQRRAGLLHRRRRHDQGVPRPHAAPVVHSFRRLSASDQGAHAERHRGRSGKSQYHRGGVGPMSALSEQTRERIRAEFAKYPNKRAATLPALHIVQDEHRQVSTEATARDRRVARAASGRSQRHAELLRILPQRVRSAGEASRSGFAAASRARFAAARSCWPR